MAAVGEKSFAVGIFSSIRDMIHGTWTGKCVEDRFLPDEPEFAEDFTSEWEMIGKNNGKVWKTNATFYPPVFSLTLAKCSEYVVSWIEWKLGWKEGTKFSHDKRKEGDVINGIFTSFLLILVLLYSPLHWKFQSRWLRLTIRPCSMSH